MPVALARQVALETLTRALAAFSGYALALWQMSIWYKRKWGTTVRATIDGVIFALLTAGTFGWLWPK